MSNKWNFKSPMQQAIAPRQAHANIPDSLWERELARDAFFGAATNFGHAYLANTLVNKTATRIRHEAFRALVRGGLRDLWAMGSSEGVSRVVNDTSALAKARETFKTLLHELGVSLNPNATGPLPAQPATSTLTPSRRTASRADLP